VGYLSQSRDDFDRMTAEILLVNVDIGLNLAAIAADRYDPSAKARTIRSARRAYDEVLKWRLTVQMEGSEITNLENRLLLLKKRLRALGESFD
jgi:hypothetical protein